jgi:hypothetical protein
MGNKLPPNKLPLEILASYELSIRTYQTYLLENLEILFIQRSVNPNDVHSG